MDMPVNSFKRAIASASVAYGAWLVSGAPATAEALGSSGFDFLVVDTEHTPIDPPQVSEILRAIAGTSVLAETGAHSSRSRDVDAHETRRATRAHVAPSRTV